MFPRGDLRIFWVAKGYIFTESCRADTIVTGFRCILTLLVTLGLFERCLEFVFLARFSLLSPFLWHPAVSALRRLF